MLTLASLYSMSSQRVLGNEVMSDFFGCFFFGGGVGISFQNTLNGLPGPHVESEGLQMKWQMRQKGGNFKNTKSSLVCAAFRAAESAETGTGTRKIMTTQMRRVSRLTKLVWQTSGEIIR